MGWDIIENKILSQGQFTFSNHKDFNVEILPTDWENHKGSFVARNIILFEIDWFVDLGIYLFIHHMYNITIYI